MTHTCMALHSILYGGEIFSFKNLEQTNMPTNGIYVMFEKDEYGHGAHRIIRIGTHTGQGQLRNRILQHYKQEKKNRSIFRKNIGRCILNRDNDPYLDIWEYDTTSREDRDKYLKFINKDKEVELEKLISNFIQENTFFCLFDIEDKKARLTYEKKLIGTVAQCNDCQPSEVWLGKHSPIAKIRENGLWQVQGLKSSALTPKDLLFLSSALVKLQSTDNKNAYSYDKMDTVLTEERLGKLLKYYLNVSITDRIDSYKENNFHSEDIAYLWGRLKRAAINQIDSGDATISRYALWTETVKNKLEESIALIESDNNEKAIEILVQLANSMSAFYEIQSYFDPMHILDKKEKY